MLGSYIKVIVRLLALRYEFKDIGPFAYLGLGLESCADGLEYIIPCDHAPIGDIVDGQGGMHLDAKVLGPFPVLTEYLIVRLSVLALNEGIIYTFLNFFCIDA